MRAISDQLAAVTPSATFVVHSSARSAFSFHSSVPLSSRPACSMSETPQQMLSSGNSGSDEREPARHRQDARADAVKGATPYRICLGLVVI
jgi:hypothetical protein